MTVETLEPIRSFRGPFAWASNFWPVEVVWNGHICRSVEHGYQAAKSLDLDVQRYIVSSTTASVAKRRGRLILPADQVAPGYPYIRRPDWLTVNRAIMLDLVRQKFAHDALGSFLVETHPRPIIEENTWHDNFWGRCVCNGCDAWRRLKEEDYMGLNHLGLILMQVRTELIERGLA